MRLSSLPSSWVSSLKSLFWVIVATLLTAACSTTESGYIGMSGQGTMYYEARGKGEPLLLLHGHSLDRRMWAGQTKVFAKHYRVITPDFRGYGLSSKQREDLPMTHADDILSLMDSLHISKAHVVGLSMGGFVAGDLLALHPERLLSCVLCSGGIRSSKGPSQPMDSAESWKRDAEIATLKAKGVDKMKEEWIEQLINTGGSRRETMRKPLTRMIREWDAWQPLHKEVRLFYGQEAWQHLQEHPVSGVPLLVVWGECEHKKGSPRELQYVSPGTHITLPDCGHMMNMEQPTLFNSTVLRFLHDR